MLYDYRCAACGRETEQVNTIAERHTGAPACCGAQMTLFISQAPMGFVDREVRYVCPVTGQGVTTRRQRNEIMARENLVDANDIAWDKKKAQKAKAKKQAKLDKIHAEQAVVAKELGNIMKEKRQSFLSRQ